MASDEILLLQYSATGDPGAFRELADRYAGLVYSIGMRVTGDQHTAEDVCQDCFMELAQKSRLVRENVAGWLHALATSRSLNAIRSRRRRTRREQAVATGGGAVAESSESQELQTLVDRALNGLSDDLRLPIIYHYLQGESQQQVAERLGINQATVSRRLQRGVKQLRKRLKAFGVMTTTMAVVSLFGHGAAQAAPVPVTGALAKIGLGGVGMTAAKSASGSLSAAAMVLGAVFANVMAFLFLQGWMLFLVISLELAILVRSPAWLRELLRPQAFGRDVVAHPMYPFRRWTWTVPPPDWRQRLALWSFVAFTFGVTAFGDRRDIISRPGFVMAFGLMTVLYFTLVVRLAWRVWRHRDRLADAGEGAPEGELRWTSLENTIGATIAAAIAAIWLLCIPREQRFVWSKGALLGWTWLTMCGGMLVWTLADRGRTHYHLVGLRHADSRAENECERQPVAQRYHIVLITCTVLAAGCCILSAGAHSLGIVELLPVQKGFPPYVIMASTMGIVLSSFLLRRVIRVRRQLPRSAWLPLLALSIMCVMLGAALLIHTLDATGHKPRPLRFDSVQTNTRSFRPTFPENPAKLDLAEQYAEEAAIITIPDGKLPDDWHTLRYDNKYPYPLPAEGGGDAISLGLPDVPELDKAASHLSRIYTSETAQSKGNDSTCVVHAFCCESADAAQQLNEAWHNRGLCVDRLVIFVRSRTRGLRAPTSSDQAPVPTLLQHIEKTRSKLSPPPES